jgi:ABC-2 type transport system permease protein
VVRGEILWPGLLITALAWTLIALATILSGVLFTRTGTALRASVGTAAALLAPSLAYAQLAIHNGMALLFPAWVTLGTQRARGLDAMGQRIITLAGSWLALIVLALPGAIAGSIIWFAFRMFLGSAALIPAAGVASGLLLLEVLVITEMLGPAYERLDLTAIEPPQS